MENRIIVTYIFLGIMLIFYLVTFLIIWSRYSKNISNFQHTYHTISNKFDNVSNYYLLTGNRTDMLGSFSQGFIVTIIKILATQQNPCIIININEKLFTDWTNFHEIPLKLLQDPNSKKYEQDKWKTVGSENMQTHTNARRTLIKNLFPEKIKRNIKKIKAIKVQNSELQLSDGMLRHGEVQKFTKSFRTSFITKFLPKEFEDDNFIVIHYRAGDVLQQSKRFKHSSRYSKICKELTEKFPHSRIYVFTSKIPEYDSDNLEVFKKYANNIYQAQDYSTIACWAIFMHCKVFVMSYSCTSVCPALMRDLDKITYYDKLDRPLPDKSWKYWYE